MSDVIEAKPGEKFYATVEGAPPGVPMGIEVQDFDGNTVVPHTTTGITEVAPGVYASYSLNAPNSVGHYLVIWDDGSFPLDENDVASEELVVRTLPGQLPGLSEIEGMRAAFDATLPDSATIFRRTRFPDGLGGYTYTWQPHLEDEPCRLGFPSGGESDTREQSKIRLVDESTQVVWLRAKTDVKDQDRIQINGETLYDVNAVLVRGNWEIARRLRVTETEWQDDEPDA
jgi:hypothetical protein